MYNHDEVPEADAGAQDCETSRVQGKRDVVTPIGLQAYRLDINDSGCLMGSEEVTFEAKLPWWRCGEEVSID